MDSEEEAANFSANLQQHITTAEELCERCKVLSHVAGIGKLLKKCHAELKFLHGLSKKTTQQRVTHLRSSNLSHLEGILAAVETFPDVVEVLKPFACPPMTHPLFVDLICNHGYTWVKVIARKAQALHFVWAGGGQFGERNIVDQAQQFVVCADRFPLNYKTPQVLFLFTAGVTQPVKDALREVKVDSHGDVVEADPDIERQILQLMDSSVPLESDEEEDLEENVGQGQTTSQVNDLFRESDIPPPSSESLESGNGKSHSEAGDVNKNPEELSRNLQSLELLGDLDNSNNEGSIPSASEFLAAQNDYCDDSGDELVSFFGQPEDKGKGSARSAKKQKGKKEKKRIVDIVGCDKEELRSEESGIFTHLPVIKKVNLDITTLICLVTNLCHGESHWVFEEDILNQQAAAERRQPLLPDLNKYLQDKDLYVCETALQDFHTILDTVGGPCERERAHQLLDKVTIVKDQTSARAQGLAVSAKIKDRAKIIFGTGDTLQAITVSANVGFVRAAVNQDVHFATYLIDSRALTEQKQRAAAVWTPESSSSS